VRFVKQLKDDTPRGQTREALKRMIRTRRYSVGDKLPPYRQLAQEFGVALLTLERVMNDLAEEGIVYRLHGKGTFLKRVPDTDHRLQIGLIYPASRTHLLAAPYLNEMMTGVVARCDARHADLQILSCRAAGGTIPPHDVATRVDGIILVGVLSDEYIAQFIAERVPLVLLDAQSETSVYSICVDNAQAVNLVVSHLHQLGHRRIAYLDSPWPNYVPGDPRTNATIDCSDNRERREAYLAEMHKLGLSDGTHVYEAAAGSYEPQIPQAIEDLKRGRDAPTALLAYDATQASAFCTRAQKAGLRIPGDVSVAAAVGAGGDRLAGDLLLTYTCARFREMGRRAMEVLAERICRRDASRFVERIPCDLISGSTTSAPRR